MENFYGYMKVVYLLYVGGLFKIFKGSSEVNFGIIIVRSVWKRIRVKLFRFVVYKDCVIVVRI